MAATKDLWGELEPASLIVRTPATILKEQAAFLGAKTQNILEAVVYSENVGGGRFGLAFDIVVPSLDNYSYRLMTIYYPMGLYPVQANVTGEPSVTLKTEDEFVTWLQTQLTSAETRKIVGALLSQATS